MATTTPPTEKTIKATPPTERKSLKTKKKEETETTTPTISLNTNFMLLSEKKDFESIIKLAGERVLVIEFFANWCGPCKMLGNKLEEMANLYNGKILVVKIDIDDFEEIALEHDVSAMPTFMFMKNQKKLEQFSSSKGDVLEKALEKYAGKLEGTAEAENSATKPVSPAVKK